MSCSKNRLQPRIDLERQNCRCIDTNNQCNGSFTLADPDSDPCSDLDSCTIQILRERDPDLDLNQSEKFWIILCSHRVWGPNQSPSPDPAMWMNHKGLFTLGMSVSAAVMLAILLWLKTMDLLQNGLQPNYWATLLCSMSAVSLASSQYYRSIGADAHCKWTLSGTSHCFTLGGAIVTHLPLTATAWVQLWLQATCGMSFTLHRQCVLVFPYGFLPPSEGLEIVPIGTTS